MRASSATLAAALIAPLVLAACGGGGSREVVLDPAATTKCLEAQRIVVTSIPPDHTLTDVGITTTLSFNFKNWSKQVPPPQGLILFAADSKKAKSAQAGLVSFVKQAAGADAQHLAIRLRRNALVAWTTPGGGSKQDTAMVQRCLTPSAAG